MAPIKEKMIENQFNQFGYVQSGLLEAQTRSRLHCFQPYKKGRGRLRKTLEDIIIKKKLMVNNIPENLVFDQGL